MRWYFGCNKFGENERSSANRVKGGRKVNLVDDTEKRDSYEQSGYPSRLLTERMIEVIPGAQFRTACKINPERKQDGPNQNCKTEAVLMGAFHKLYCTVFRNKCKIDE